MKVCFRLFAMMLHVSVYDVLVRWIVKALLITRARDEPVMQLLACMLPQRRDRKLARR
jgi:hypothetical protein